MPCKPQTLTYCVHSPDYEPVSMPPGGLRTREKTIFLFSQPATSKQGINPFCVGHIHHYEALHGDAPAFLCTSMPEALLVD